MGQLPRIGQAVAIAIGGWQADGSAVSSDGGVNQRWCPLPASLPARAVDTAHVLNPAATVVEAEVGNQIARACESGAAQASARNGNNGRGPEGDLVDQAHKVLADALHGRTTYVYGVRRQTGCRRSPVSNPVHIHGELLGRVVIRASYVLPGASRQRQIAGRRPGYTIAVLKAGVDLEVVQAQFVVGLPGRCVVCIGQIVDQSTAQQHGIPVFCTQLDPHFNGPAVIELIVECCRQAQIATAVQRESAVGEWHPCIQWILIRTILNPIVIGVSQIGTGAA